MNFNKLLSVTASVFAFLTFQGAANAQETPKPAPAASEADEDVIIITAEKRAQNLQDVPVAVTAFTSAQRDKLGVSTVQDLTNYTPGVAYQAGLDRFYVRGIGRSTNNLASDGGTAIYSDGVYTSSSYAGATPGIFTDRIEILRGPQGTLYGRNAIGGAMNVVSKRPSDDFQAEVRGVAATFDRYEAYGRVSVPLSEQLRVSATGGYIDQGEGYFNNVSGNRSQGQNGYSTLLEAAIEGDITPDLSFYARARSSIYDYSPRGSTNNTPFRAGTAGSGGFVVSGSLGPSAQTAARVGSTALNVLYNGPAISENPAANGGDKRNFNNDTWNHQTLKDTYDVAGEVSWDIGGTNLKYITGAQRYNYEQISDFDATNVRQFTVPVAGNPTCLLPGPALQCATVDGPSESHYIEDKRWWSHELNFSSDNDSAVQWLTGLYYYKEFFDQPLFFPTTGLARTRVSNPGYCNDPAAGCTSVTPQIANPSGIIFYTDTAAENTSYAGFGQVDWNFTSTVKLTGGLRYTHDEKTATESFRSICYGAGLGGIFFPGVCPSLTVAGAGATAYDVTTANAQLDPGVLTPTTQDLTTGLWRRKLGDSWQATTGTLGIQWDPSEDTMLYAKYSRGYKAGAFNAGSGVRFPEADPEHVGAFEVGFKSRPMDNLQANVSAFYYDYSDRQTPVTVPAGVILPTATSIFENVPKSISQGIEVETIWEPIENAHFNVTYAYLDAYVDDDGPGYIDGFHPTLNATAQNIVGASLPLSPKHRVTVHADYTFNLDAGDLYLGASYIWRDEQYGSFFNQPWYHIPSYGQTDLQAVFTSNSNWSVVAAVKNVADDEGYDAVFPDQLISGTVYKTTGLTPPRTASVELRAKF